MSFYDSSLGSPGEPPRGADQQIIAANPLAHIGWDEARSIQFESHAEAGLRPGRIARVDGRSVLVIASDGESLVNLRAESSTDLQRKAETSEDLPSAGDWVALRERPGHETDEIDVVLPRTSQLTRTRQIKNSAVERQVVAANLDAAFVVQAANNANVRRLEREAAQVASSGAEPVIVLNKADLCEDIAEVLADVRTALPGIPVHAVSGATGDGVDALSAYARPDKTVAFIGASGVGKSTLTNRLLGRAAMDTGAVREDDQRGRHTTTARHLLVLDGGGALIDTPGMRSLGLSDAGQGVMAVFDDIARLALSCRFSDCSHESEPGCAIREALNDCSLDESRLSSFKKLTREIEFVDSKSDMRLRTARRVMLKARTKRGRKMIKARDRFGRAK